MIPNLIPPSKSLGYKEFFLDFLAGKNPPKNFYLAVNLETVAEKLDRVEFDRDELISILKKQNTLYGATDKTLANIERLKNPRAVCVLAGQQAGFLGGPLYSLNKMLGIVKSSKIYEEKLKRPVIPVFWIAGDDHDFKEVNHFFILNRLSEVCQITHPSNPEKDLSVSEIYFSDTEALAETLSYLREYLGESEFTSILFDLIERCYTSSDTFVTAFGKFMTGLMNDFAPVFFSPSDPDVKKLAIPVFRTAINKQDEIHSLIQDANGQIIQAGYDLQVEKKENTTHIFYNLDGRMPVFRNDKLFTCGERMFTQPEILKEIDECPEKFSFDVLMRPVLQSFLFPTLAQKSGPSEIAYLAQVNPLFELFGLPAPCHQPRPTLTILEKRIEKQMAEYGISFEALTGDIEQVINRVLEQTFPEDIEMKYKKLGTQVKDSFEEFSRTSLNFDPSLNKFAQQIFGKIDFSLKTFENKVFSSHKKKSQEVRERLYRLGNSVFPNRGLQERSLNITYFIARYGFGIITFLYEKIDSEQKAHQIISLSEFV